MLCYLGCLIKETFFFMTVYTSLLTEHDSICLRRISSHNSYSMTNKVLYSLMLVYKRYFLKTKALRKSGRMSDSMFHYDAYKHYTIQYIV